MFFRCPKCERIHGEHVSEALGIMTIKRSGDIAIVEPKAILCRCGAAWRAGEGWDLDPQTIRRNDTDEPASNNARQTKEIDACQKPSTQPSRTYRSRG